MGQTHVLRFIPELMQLSGDGKLARNHHQPLSKLNDAARGYEIFDKKEEDCRKLVLTPNVPTAVAAV